MPFKNFVHFVQKEAEKLKKTCHCKRNSEKYPDKLNYDDLLNSKRKKTSSTQKMRKNCPTNNGTPDPAPVASDSSSSSRSDPTGLVP